MDQLFGHSVRLLLSMDLGIQVRKVRLSTYQARPIFRKSCFIAVNMVNRK